MLAPEPIRRDGLPASWHGHRRRSHVGAMLSLEGAPRLGRPAQALRAAVEHDLLGRSPTALSEALGLRDHRLYHKDGRLLSDDGDTRRFREYRSEGRRLLRALGAWPWAHAVPSGRVPRSWWERDEFLAPLECWHRHHIEALREDADFRESALAGGRRWGSPRRWEG